MATRIETGTVDPRALLRERVQAHGVRGAARELGTSAAFVSQVMLGQRAPGPKLLRALGVEQDVERVVNVRYRRAG